MSTKRRVAATVASPELKLRSQKRRKLSVSHLDVLLDASHPPNKMDLQHGARDSHRALIV